MTSPEEITVREDAVTGAWRFELRGHAIEVEPIHGFVKVDGQLHELAILRGLREVEDLAGKPLQAIVSLLPSDSPSAPEKLPHAPVARPLSTKDARPRPTSPKRRERRIEPPLPRTEEEPKGAPPPATPHRFLTAAEVMQKLGIKSRTTLWKLRRTDETFPKPRKRGTDQLVWFEHEMDAWMERREPGR